MSDVLTSKEVFALPAAIFGNDRVGMTREHYESMVARIAELERPSEASGSQEVALNQGPRLAEGVGSNPDVPGHDRQPNEPGAACVTCGDTGAVRDSEYPYLAFPCPDCKPLTKGETP